MTEVSGKGAAPFVSAWLEIGVGEAPGQLVQNLLFAGRPEDASDDELREAHETGRVALMARLATQLTRLKELQGDGTNHGLIHQTALLDSAVVNALAALNATVDPRSELRQLEKFNPGNTARIAELQPLVADYVALEQDYFAARAANSTLAALEAEFGALKQTWQLDEQLPQERDMRAAIGELLKRGKPIKVNAGPL
jgi:hypothetical protein